MFFASVNMITLLKLLSLEGFSVNVIDEVGPDIQSLLQLRALALNMIASVSRQLFTFLSFTVKEGDKLFWDENVGHVKIRYQSG